MNDKQNNENKWKDFLLKSSLPLEQLVAQKLEEKKLHIAGEYPYIRPNEQNINTEFSIDLHAYQYNRPIDKVDREKDRVKRLNLLIECKYNYPGIKWVFSPHPRWQGDVGHIATFHDQKKHLYYDLTSDLPICTRGIELNSTGFDPNTISRGLNQLRYGMPNLILQEAACSTNTTLGVFFLIGLILVTTAELYVLKTNQKLEDYYTAKSLEEVAESVSSLVVLQERGPHLNNYCEELVQSYIMNNSMDEIVPSSRMARKRYAKEKLEKIIPQLSRVIVININYLEETLDKIKYIFDTNL